MQCSPLELKEKLLKHLDNDNNVVDMQGVLDVILVLEKYPITKEHLEQTRIGKVVNDMRRKTANRELARRAKDLVRKWQVLVQVQHSPAPTPTADLSRVSSSASLSNGMRQVTVDRSSNGHGASSQVPEHSELRPSSRLQGTGSRPSTPMIMTSRSATSSPCLPSRSLTPSTTSFSTKPVTPAMTSLHSSTPMSKMPTDRSYTPTDSKSRTAQSVAPMSRSLTPSAPMSRSLTPSACTSKPVTPATPMLPAVPSSSKLRMAGQSSPPIYARTPSSLSRPSTPNSYPSKPIASASSIHPVASSSKLYSLEQSASMVELSSAKSTPANARIMTNGLDSSVSTTYALDECVKTSGKRKMPNYPEGTTDSKRICHDFRNGSIKPSSNGVWSVHHDTGTNGSSASFSGARLSSPDCATHEAPIARLKIKINRTSASGSVSSPVANSPSTAAASVRKPSKVATTAQLIQKLHASNELRLVASETLNKIATNQIKREIDEQPTSVVPAGAKPRPHKKRRYEIVTEHEPPPMTDADLMEVKAERVRNFLQMSAEASPPPAADNELLGLLGRLAEDASESAPFDIEASVGDREVIPDVDGYEAALLQLPSLDNLEVDWNSDIYTVPEERGPPTEADVERLINGQWPNVNGQFDYRGAWADWTRTYSVPSYNGDPLHILPYVDLGD